MDTSASYDIEVGAGVDMLMDISLPIVIIILYLYSPISISIVIFSLLAGSVEIEGPSEWAIPKVKGGYALCARTEFSQSLIKLMSAMQVTSICWSTSRIGCTPAASHNCWITQWNRKVVVFSNDFIWISVLIHLERSKSYPAIRMEIKEALSHVRIFSTKVEINLGYTDTHQNFAAKCKQCLLYFSFSVNL